MKIELLNNEWNLKRFAAQLTYKSHRIIHKELVADVVINRSIYTGFCILNLPKKKKTLMFDWHANYRMVVKYVIFVENIFIQIRINRFYCLLSYY